jgi:ribonuclease HI
MPRSEFRMCYKFLVEIIDKSSPWTYFDGASLGDPPLGEAGGTIYFHDSHSIRFKVELGYSTNKFFELVDLKLLLTLALEYGINHIQFFVDSLMVIKRMRMLGSYLKPLK